jgi:hypothetical protein
MDRVIEDPVGMEGSGLGNWTGPFSRTDSVHSLKGTDICQNS